MNVNGYLLEYHGIRLLISDISLSHSSKVNREQRKIVARGQLLYHIGLKKL